MQSYNERGQTRQSPTGSTGICIHSFAVCHPGCTLASIIRIRPWTHHSKLGRKRRSSFTPVRSGSSASGNYSESPFGGGMASTAHELEGHNDDLLSGLLGKVDVLKSLTIGIGDEVRAGNRELSGMGSHWCLFMAFLMVVLWIFVVLWWWRR